MAEGSCGHRNTSFGYLQPVPKDYGGKQINSCDDRVRQGEQSSFQQKTSKTSCVDKQTGKYTRTTIKEVVYIGEIFKERSTGRVGYKDEYKITSTDRVGNKCGYTKHQREEKFVKVNYSGSSSNNKGKNSARSNKNDEDEESDENEGGEGYKKYEESDGDERVLLAKSGPMCRRRKVISYILSALWWCSSCSQRDAKFERCG